MAATIPITGASIHWSPVCGSAEEATSAIPTYGTTAAISRTPISRRSPRRPIATCPARPDDASMPENATSTSGNANTMSSSEGEPAIEAGSVSTSGWNSSARPNTSTSSWTSRSASTSTAARSNRRGPGPRIAVNAT